MVPVHHFLVPAGSTDPFADADSRISPEILGQRQRIAEVCQSWLLRSPSSETRSNYECDLRQFLAFAGVPADRPEALASVRPHQVADWRDRLREDGLTNSSIRRKMTALRSLFSFLQSYGFLGANPAHSDFVAAPAVPRDGKTVALSPEDCRRLLDAPLLKITREDKHGVRQEITPPSGTRDRALLGVLAFTGCRVGELVRLKVKSYKQNGVHRVLEIYGKGGKERLVPLHLEAAERLAAWLDIAGIREDLDGPLFRPTKAAWGRDRLEFTAKPMTRRAVQKLVDDYAQRRWVDRTTPRPESAAINRELIEVVKSVIPDLPTQQQRVTAAWMIERILETGELPMQKEVARMQRPRVSVERGRQIMAAVVNNIRQVIEENYPQLAEQGVNGWDQFREAFTRTSPAAQNTGSSQGRAGRGA